MEQKAIAVPRHCAKFSKQLFPHMAQMLGCPATLLDPMGGVGGIFELARWFPDTQITCLEIEQLWANADPRIIQGDALDMPFDDESFDAVCTSPDYGNRMADHHNATDKSKRNTYRHSLGQPLHPRSLAGLQWGPQYRFMHTLMLLEIDRVLKAKGRFLLNIKDHYRGDVLQHVTDWYIETTVWLGYDVKEHRKIEARGNRQGKNGHLRAKHESLILFVKRGESYDDQSNKHRGAGSDAADGAENAA